MFSKPVQAFNLGGKNEVQTWSGTVCSLCIYVLTFAFGLLKLQHLIEYKNPTLMSSTELLETSEETYSLDSDEFMMAFALQKYGGEILRYDPRYVRWIIRTWEREDDESTFTFYPLHQCSDEEVSNFYRPESAVTEKEVEKL